MKKIEIKGLKVYAHHGVLPEETRSGTEFIINMSVDVDFTPACLTDNLDGTVNYAEICDWILDEMKINSKLIEHVAFRIVSRVFNEEKRIENVEIELIKINAPIHADLEHVAVKIGLSRNEFLELSKI